LADGVLKDCYVLFLFIFSSLFSKSLLNSFITRSLSLWILGYNSTISSHTDSKKWEMPLRIRLTRLFRPVFFDTFRTMSVISFSQNDAMRIFDLSVILLQYRHNCEVRREMVNLLWLWKSGNIKTHYGYVNTCVWYGKRSWFHGRLFWFFWWCAFSVKAKNVKHCNTYIQYLFWVCRYPFKTLTNLKTGLSSFLFIQQKLRYP
jgi:hypothetical protein